MVAILNGVSIQYVRQVVVKEPNIVNELVTIHLHKTEVMDVKPSVKSPNQVHAKSKTVQVITFLGLILTNYCVFHSSQMVRIYISFRWVQF